MKSAAIGLFLLGLPIMVSAQDARSSPCLVIAQLDARASAYRERIAQLLADYTERHPEVVALQERLAHVEAARAEEVARAAALGRVCSGGLELGISATRDALPCRQKFRGARDRANHCGAV